MRRRRSKTIRRRIKVSRAAVVFLWTWLAEKVEQAWQSWIWVWRNQTSAAVPLRGTWRDAWGHEVG